VFFVDAGAPKKSNTAIFPRESRKISFHFLGSPATFVSIPARTAQHWLQSPRESRGFPVIPISMQVSSLHPLNRYYRSASVKNKFIRALPEFSLQGCTPGRGVILMSGVLNGVGSAEG